MSNKTFTDADACRALLRDLRIRGDSPLGKALSAGEFSRKTTGTCIIETDAEQVRFNVRERTFTFVEGFDLKTGDPHRAMGRFWVDDKGELRARFE